MCESEYNMVWNCQAQEQIQHQWQETVSVDEPDMGLAMLAALLVGVAIGRFSKSKRK